MTATGGTGAGRSAPGGFPGRRGPDLTVGPIGRTLITFALPVLGCLYLFSSLSLKTMVFFAAWNAVGVIVYLVFSRRTSTLAAQ